MAVPLQQLPADAAGRVEGVPAQVCPAPVPEDEAPDPAFARSDPVRVAEQPDAAPVGQIALPDQLLKRADHGRLADAELLRQFPVGRQPRD